MLRHLLALPLFGAVSRTLTGFAGKAGPDDGLSVTKQQAVEYLTKWLRWPVPNSIGLADAQPYRDQSLPSLKGGRIWIAKYRDVTVCLSANNEADKICADECQTETILLRLNELRAYEPMQRAIDSRRGKPIDPRRAFKFEFSPGHGIPTDPVIQKCRKSWYAEAIAKRNHGQVA